MKEQRNWLTNYLQQWLSAWNHFWFLPRDGATLGLVRILTGSMVLYTHAAWTMGLDLFLSSGGILPASYRFSQDDGYFYWSHFDWFDSAAWLWGTHSVGLVIVTLFMLGLWTRWTSILTFLLVVSYANRTLSTNFGLDQIVAFLCLYLAVGNSGSAFSIDALRRRKVGDDGIGAGQGGSTMNNIAIRLIQVHMCIVYLFAGLGKLQGTFWWNGEAIWGAMASYEYQTLDMTWLAHAMWLVNLLTLIAVAWEVAYPFLIWPRLTRPIMLLLAVLLHLGIGSCMGMMTFGLIMIYGNLAFVDSSTVRSWFSRFDHST